MPTALTFFIQTPLPTPASASPTVVDLCSPSPVKTSPPLVPADRSTAVGESHLSLAELEAPNDQQLDEQRLEKDFASLRIENPSANSTPIFSPSSEVVDTPQADKQT